MSKATKDNLAKLIDVAQISQERLGDIAGVTRSAVSHWLSGKAEPRMGAIHNISEHFGIPMSCIIEPNGMDGVKLSDRGRLFKPSATIEASEEEQQLINLFRSADPRGREVIMRNAQSEARHEMIPTETQSVAKITI